MNVESKRVRPAAQSGQILARTGKLETLASTKMPPTVKRPPNQTFSW